MILHRIALRGLTCFRDETSVDLDDLPQGLVAVSGANGAGKSTLLEAVIVAIYGTFASRPGSVYDYCSGRDAFAEVDVTHGGHRWRFRRLIDTVKRGQEIHIWKDDEPQTEGKTGEAKKILADHFPPLRQLLATAFAAQGGGGAFLSLGATERKALVVTMLGLDRIQELAEQAAERRRESIGKVDTARALSEVAAERAGRLAELRDDLDRAERAARAHADAIVEVQREEREARREFDAAVADDTKAKDALSAIDVEIARLSDSRKVAEADHSAALAAHAAAQGAAQELDGLGSPGELHGLRERLAELDDSIRSASERVSEAQVEADRAGHAADRARTTLAALESERRRLGSPDVTGATALVTASIDAGEKREALADGLRAADRKVRDLDGSASEEARLTRERDDADRRGKLVDDVPCGGVALTKMVFDGQEIESKEERIDCSTCPLLTEAITARAQLPDLISDLEWVEGAGTDLPAAREAFRLLEKRDQVLARRANDLPRFRSDLQRARAASDRLDEIAAEIESLPDVDALRHGQEQATAALRDIRAQVNALSIERAAVAAEIADLEALATRRDNLIALSAVVDDRAAAVDRASVAHEAADDEVTKALTRVTAAKTDVDQAKSYRIRAGTDYTAADGAKRQADQRADELGRTVTRARGAVAAYADADTAATAAATALHDVEQLSEDVDLLARALGRDGVQAMELDAAGPAVSDLATEIVRAVYGPRFAIQLITQALRKGAAGKRGETKEVFEVQVTDADHATTGPAERLSGGEQVVISEALKLALSVFASQSGTRIRTLIRDESDGALDDERAHLYPSMLRRALQLGDFERVLLVSHRPGNVDACDGAIRVSSGRISTD